jgi:NAD-dependent dihydropyrimidine dehydrogenase PreA subunit
VTYVIVEPCIGTKNASCVDVCPVSCIYESTDAASDMYYINPDECIECGACEPECPVNAIFHESAVPDEWKSFTELNRKLSGL